jgi:exodeoxyribonuclease VII small subunit
MARKPAEAPAPEALPDDIRGMSFEQALEALEAIVERLESGEVELERSIEMYSRGTLLKRHCEEKLRVAGERVEKIIVGPAGEAAGVEPADLE